ncbi:MAG TPA: sigma-70 family RNA polymerase sigma factor [Anaerolineales bacterium]|nr:sigma-70 family RNA polymerase sigma factor [Anaerolineales bacterium]
MDQDKHAADVSVRINNENGRLRADDPGVQEPVSDEALADRISRRDSAALESLYDRYAARVLGVAFKVIGDRIVAEDVLQETFWRVWKNAASYQSERGSFASWLFRIVRNLAIDAYRRQSVRPQALYSAETGEPVLEATPDPNADVAEQAQVLLQNRQVQNALATLPRAQRQVIEMAYFYGMTRQEIAEATGEALGTIHTRARLALMKLRDELTKEEFEG